MHSREIGNLGPGAQRVASLGDSKASAFWGSRAAVFGQALLAAALGVFLVWGIGFSQIEAVHNASHDVRHSNGFPCH